MNLQELCAAVQESRLYLEGFTRRGYEPSFQAYVQRFGPAYMAAVSETAGDEAALTALADGILDILEQGWQAKSRWSRSGLRMNEKQMMVAYLSPMLLGLEEPLCRRLAELLRDRWALRWPKDAYRTATYAKIKSGFRNAILGLEIKERTRDDEEE